jgi:4-amino-4-deoxy-L-arabinose transferase-like glycosyltransferase
MRTNNTADTVTNYPPQRFFIGNLGIAEQQIRETQFDRSFGEYPYVTDYPQLYYTASSFVEHALNTHDFLTRFFAARIFSVFLGMLVVLLGYLIARTIGLSYHISLLTAAIIAFQPMLAATAASANPDIMLILLFTLFSYGAVRLLRDGADTYNALILLTATIGAVLTKGPGIVLIAMLGALVVYEFQRRTHISWKKLILIGMVALISIWVLIPGALKEKYVRTESVSAFNSTTESIITYLDKYTFNTGRLNLTNTSYWGNFGWLEVGLDKSIISTIVIIEFICALGILLMFIKKYPNLPARKYLIFFVLMTTLLQLAIRFYDWRIFDINGKILISTPGRYFLPNIAIHIIVLATGLMALLRTNYLRVLSLKILLGALILLNFYAIFHVIIPHYYL